MRRPELPRADRALLASLVALFAVGLVASAWVPGAEEVLNTVAAAVVVALVSGWLVFHAASELWLWLDVHGPAREPRPGWRTVLTPDPGAVASASAAAEGPDR